MPFTWAAFLRQLARQEMIFGYAGAVIAGFLLTAVRNWADQQTATRAGLAALVGPWLAERLAPLLAWHLLGLFIAIPDLLFLPAVGVAVALLILQAGQQHNYLFMA